MNQYEQLRKKVEQQVRRMIKAENERNTLLSQTVYISTLGLLLTLPIIFGAYIGIWLDNLSDGYSVRWSVSMIILGVVIGAINVYLFIKD